MSLVVIDASAGVEIVARTRRGLALRRLLVPGSELWVPHHFYAEALAGLRRLTVFDGKLTDSQATVAISRLLGWHLHQVAVAPLLSAAWQYRHNLTAGDALYVALAEQLGASLLTDDQKLASSPAVPSRVTILRLAVR